MLKREMCGNNNVQPCKEIYKKENSLTSFHATLVLVLYSAVVIDAV